MISDNINLQLLKTFVAVTINPLTLKAGVVIGEIDSHYFSYYMAYSTNLRASSPIPICYFHFKNLNSMNLVIYSILFNSVVKTIGSITCYSDLLYREANGSAIQVISLWTIKLGLLLSHHACSQI